MVVRIDPTTQTLAALRRQNITWHDLSGELIDNSLDAGATRIEIRFEKRVLIVSDNGCGCIDISKMLTLGSHQHMDTTKLGRYGVGLKDVSTNLWCCLQIRSTRAGETMRGTYNVPAIERSGAWEIPDPEIRPAAEGEIGTALRFVGVQKGSPDSFEKLAEDIGFTFSPAIRQGVQIEIIYGAKQRRIICRAYEPPMLDEKVEDRFVVDGKAVRLWAGIVKDGEPNCRPGFVIQHEHRVIRGGSSIGANGYSTSRISGLIELDGRWGLTKNKTDLSDESVDRLGSCILDRCRAMFERASLKADVMKINGLSRSVETCIGELLTKTKVKGKEVRTPRGEKGTHERGNGGRKRVNVRDVQDGDRILSQLSSTGSIRIDFAHMETQESLAGVELRPFTVQFNLDHPLVAHAKATDQRLLLAFMALVLISDKARSNDQMHLFPAFRDHVSIAEVLSSLTLRIAEPDTDRRDTPKAQGTT